MEEIKPSQRFNDSISSTNFSDDEQQQPSKSRFAQIKAKFEQKNVSNVMALPSISSATTSNSSHHRNSRKEIDDLYARHRRASNDSISNNEKKVSTISSNHSNGTQNSYYRSQSLGSEKSKMSSFRRFNSADEADEEVSRIHRQGEELRRYHPPESSSITSSAANQIPSQSNVQYEVIDEEGNPMALNDVQDLIKMSGVRAREVQQPDGSFIKEYVIDDPQLLSQFRSQQQQQPPPQQQTSMTSNYIQQQNTNRDAPTPPPRVPLRPPMLFRHGGSSMNDTLPHSIQQIHVLEPQRRYEYLTTSGRRVQFFITNSDTSNGQSISDADIRELSHAINLRLLPSTTPSIPASSPPLQQHQGSSAQTAFNLPKQWQPSVDLTHRQRLGSDNQPPSNNSNVAYQQAHPDLYRSASSGALNQNSPYLVQNQPANQWHTTYRHPNSYSSNQQKTEPFQSSAQFLPQQQQQRSQSIHSPSRHPNPSSAFHQQSTAYPYQGQQQHGVRILQDFDQQRTAIGNYGNSRI